VIGASATDLVRSLYVAIGRRDFDAGFALLSEDFEWLEPDQSLIGGHHRGFEAVRQAIEMQLEVFDEFTIEPEDFFENEGRVAVPVRQRARGGASGIEVEIRIGHLWTVGNSEIVRLEVFAGREDARKAALTSS
jgi:ketosteroid isomerase-like protein